jgi:hypothetical protein
MAKKLTNFIVTLNDSAKLRDKYRDPEKRAKLLEQWDLTTNPALQEDASFDTIESEVTKETGLKQVDLWIRSTSVGTLETKRNPEYDPGA